MTHAKMKMSNITFFTKTLSCFDYKLLEHQISLLEYNNLKEYIILSNILK